MEACVAKLLTIRTADLEVQGSSLACRIVFLDKELCSTLSLFTQLHEWVPETYCWGVTLRWTSISSGGVHVAILLGMLHDKETQIYKLRHVRLYLYLWNLYVQGLWTEEMQDYAKHNTQIDVIYNSLEQLYSGKKGKKNSAREADWRRVWGGERRWSLETCLWFHWYAHLSLNFNKSLLTCQKEVNRDVSSSLEWIWKLTGRGELLLNAAWAVSLL